MACSYLDDFIADSALLRTDAPPLSDAVAAYAARRDAHDGGAVVGALVLPDTDLPAFQEVVDSLGVEPLDVAVHVSGGAGAIEPAVRWAVRQPGLRLVRLAAAVRDLDDLARGAHRVAAMVMQLEAEGLLEETRTEVALPLYGRTAGAPRWQHALDTLAMEDLTLTLRVGGNDPDDVPEPQALAGAIGDALDREVPFVCERLVHAVAERGEGGAGALQHGFLNVLLATRASLDGDDLDTVAERLTLTDPQVVTDALAEVGTTALQSTRRWFTGFASEDVALSLAELGSLELPE